MFIGLSCMGQTVSIDSISRDSVKRYYCKVVIPDTISISITQSELQSILRDNDENMAFANETIKSQYLYYRGMLQAEKPRKQAEETIRNNQLALQRLMNEKKLLMKIYETINKK
jgi:hypothetical protein